MTGYGVPRIAQEPCCTDAICECPPGDWGTFEARRRDPEFLTEFNAKQYEGSYERCDACWDMVAWVAEVPRQRQLSATRIVDLAPARFRLCSFHGATLAKTDSLARLFLIGSRP